MSKFYSLRVNDVINETEDTVSVSFVVSPDLKDIFAFKPGQYLTLRAKINNEDVQRAYSISSGVNDREWRVAIKKIENGLFSTFANEVLKAGDILEVMPPEGSFAITLDNKNSNNYLFFAAGSGITPIVSMIKSVLENEPNSSVSLFYGNKNTGSIIYRDVINNLKNDYMDRFQLIYVMSREGNDGLLFGRLDSENISKAANKLFNLENIDSVYSCGPFQMTESVMNILSDLGFDKKNIHRELFVAEGNEGEDSIEIDDVLKDKKCQVKITYYGSEWEFDMPYDKFVLDAAAEQGIDVPFSCKGGMCCTCKAKVIEGEVEMKKNYALEDDQVEDGFILTCQSLPVSEKLSIDFDQ